MHHIKDGIGLSWKSCDDDIVPEESTECIILFQDEPLFDHHTCLSISDICREIVLSTQSVEIFLRIDDALKRSRDIALIVEVEDLQISDRSLCDQDILRKRDGRERLATHDVDIIEKSIGRLEDTRDANLRCSEKIRKLRSDSRYESFTDHHLCFSISENSATIREVDTSVSHLESARKLGRVKVSAECL